MANNSNNGNPFGGTSQPNPQQLQEMMNSPMMQGLLDNPQMMGNILEQSMNTPQYVFIICSPLLFASFLIRWLFCCVSLLQTCLFAQSLLPSSHITAFV